MNYSALYGLEYNPFIKNSKDILFETKEYKEVVYRLNRLSNNKGFGMITGLPGKGKTTLIRNWCKELNKSLYKVIYIPLSTITTVEFYKLLAFELGIEPKFRKSDNFKAIQDTINYLVIDKRITPTIILDEANYISNSILNDLKILFNFDMDSRDKAIVLLVGLPNLNNILRQGIHEPLRQRIVMNYHLEGVNKIEGKEYIRAKLDRAGCKQEVFNEQALEAIINASNGTLRLINRLCDTALLIGCNQNKNTIDSEVIFLANEECELG